MVSAPPGGQAGPAHPHTPQLASMRSDGGRLQIHPLEVKGKFIRARRLVFAVLLLIYIAAPLISIGGHPSIHLDVVARRFYLFGGTFNAQDFWMVLLLTTGFVFSLLLVTAWRGRLWCGWACPQTVFLEGLYRPVERLFDGPRERRLKRAREGFSVKGLPRALGKHLGYLLISTGLAHVASALFVSVNELAGMIVDGPADHPVAFAWTTSFTVLLYLNFAWFREQFCVVLCPYGRLQSVLQDKRSISVAYDAARGEPRGKALKAAGAPKIGDCVDCKKCVMACPTAIDIREGMQMECLACMQCADACDEVMDKLKRPQGLIRYASLAELGSEPAGVLRPRLFIYAALASVCFGGLALALEVRTSFEANVLRLAGVPFVVENDTVRNQVQVHLVNKAPGPVEFELTVEGPEGMVAHLARQKLTLASLEGAHVPLAVVLPKARAPRADVKLKVHNLADGTERVLHVPFLAPR